MIATIHDARSDARAKDGKLSVRITEAPVYLTGTAKLSAVDGTGKRTFEREPVPQKFTVACAAASLAGWKLAEGPDPRLALDSHIPESFGGRRPGENELQWQHDGSGNHQIDFPIKVTGFGAAVPGKTLNLKEMEAVKGNLRFGDIILN